jgi:ribose 1,5-bisphosphokinase
VNRLSKPPTLVPSNPGALGPGRLVLVVGPSGAGKDTLLKGARAACAYDPAVVFPRRVVTRPKSDAEDHDTMEAAAFERAASDGAFALWWHAHGNGYGIPSSIDRDIRAGRTVVCNVSRTVVDAARERYGSVTVVEITAPEPVLQSRLASRQRGSDGDIAERIERSAEVERLYAADIVIRNIGRPDGGIRRLIRAIRTRARRALAKY